MTIDIDIDKERADFQAWAVRDGWHMLDAEDVASGKITDELPRLYDAWKVWQARASIPPSTGDGGDWPSIGTDNAFEHAAKALHRSWTPDGVHALIAAADAFCARFAASQAAPAMKAKP